MNAAENRTPPKWTDIANDPDFQAADWQTKQRVRGEFYRRAIEPNTPESLRADVQSQFFTRTEADVFGEREKQASTDETQPDTPNLASNALRNAGERGLDLAGNALQFVGNVADRGEKAITDALGGINPGVIGGSADEMRERGYEPDVELGGFGLDFTMRAKPEDTSTGLIDTGQAVEDISLGYEPNYTIDRALDKPSIKTIAGAAAEQGPAALADMAGLVVNLPAYLAARTQEIGEGRVRNDDREGMPEGRDYAVSGPTAAASVLLDRFALGRLLPGGKNAVTSARQIPGAVGRAAGTEGLTEAIQEGGIEYAGESVGTETGWDPVTAGRRAAGGVIVGAPTGGAVRGVTAGMEMRGNNQQGSEQATPAEAPTKQPSPAPQESPSPEAEAANVEAVGTAAELIAKPRFELSSAEREVRDSISYGDAFKALRAAAEDRGDSDAVTEMDAVSGEISAALEAETMARARNDREALTPIREQLQSASERFTRVMDRLNAPEAESEASPSSANEDGSAQWEDARREQAAEDGIADYDPNADLPDATIDIDGQQQAPEPVQSPEAAEADVMESNPSEAIANNNAGVDMAADIERAAIETNPEPTPAQAEAGNYRKGRIQLNGFDIAIENPKGSTRRGTDPEGRPWESNMAHHYGDIKGTKAADGDNLDVFVGDNPSSERAFIIDQVNADGTYDEAKIMLGFDSLEQARQGYLANYDEGWSGLGNISEMSVDDLKTWTREGATDKPYGEIQTTVAPSESAAAPSSASEIAPGSQVVHKGRKQTVADVVMHPTAGRRLVSFEDAPNNYVFEDDVSTDVSSAEAQQEGDAVTDTSPEPAASPAPTLKADGKPFQTRRAVELSKRFRDTPNAAPVEVEGGWGFTAQNNAVTAAPQAEVQPADNRGLALDSAPETNQAAPEPQESQPQPEPVAPNPSTPRQPAKRAKPRKPEALTPRQQRVSEAFGGAVTGDTVNLLTDVGYAKAGNTYVIDSINKDGTLQATNVERGSSVLISQGEWTLATRRAKAPIATVAANNEAETAQPSSPQQPSAEPTTTQNEGDPSQIDPVEKMRQDLWSKHGAPLDDLLQQETGSGIDTLTQSEADKYLKAVSLDSIRNRIAAARLDQSDGSPDGVSPSGALPPASETTPPSDDPRYKIDQSDARPVSSEDIKAALESSPELSDVTVIQSTTDLPAQSLLMMALQGVNPRDVRGLFVGDQLYVIADNVDSVQDGIKTAVHEAVGHKGIRGVLGEELKPVMRQVYRTLPMDKRGREALDEVLESYPFLDQSNPEHQLTIAEEMIAHLAEKGWNPGPVKRAVSKIRELLRRLFPKMKWTDADVMALSKQSRKWLSDQQANAQSDAEAESDMRFAMATPPGGNFDPNDSTHFSLPDESLKQAALRKMADKMSRLKVTQEAIKKSGGNINEDNDVYLAEELFHGKTERDLNEMSRNYVEKLAKQMAIRGIQQEELDAYLYARHAPERNARIAERNPNDPKYADGGSGMTNAEAAAIMQEAEASGKRLRLERLAAIVDDMLAHRREIIREGGLESSETLDAWDASYEYYVPLKGWANDEDIPVGQDGAGRMRSGRGYEIGGRETKTALGRLSKAASPSTQAIVDTTESVIRKRKNEVGNALLSLITDNPNPDLWQVFTNSNPDTQRTKVEQVDPDTGEKRIEVVERPVAMEMNERYFKTKKAGRTFYIKINDQRLLNAMRNVGPEQNNMLVRTAAAGTRALSAMMTSYNPEFMTTNFARDIQTALLNIAAEQTRDDGKIKGQKIARQTARDIPRAMKAAYRGLADPDAPRNTEWDRWFDEFIEDGAKTGYFDMKDLAGQAKEIKSIMGRANGGTMGNMLKAKKTVADFVENMNGSVENAVRLSAYVNARRAGISRKKAASLAKNLTVNFNRRGEAGTALNAAYMFANASIQGTMNVARTMATVKDTPVGGNRMNIWGRMNAAQKLAVGMAVGSYAMAMFNRMMSDEDDDGELFYDKIPSHVKERNLIIMTGGKNYVRIPLPYGYNIFSNIGTHAESVMAGKSSLTEASKDMTLAILGSFSPIGFQDSEDTSNLVMKNLTPTLLGSVTQVAVNEDFAGRVIFKENFPFGTPKPDSALAFRSTPSAYQDFAQYINKLTRGSEYRSGGVDVSPDVLQHVVNYYGGGAWSFTEKVVDSIKRTATGEAIDAHRIPFVGRFRSEVNEYGDIQTFYERRTEIGQLHEEFINLPREEARSFYDEHGGKIGLFDMAKDLEGTLTDLRKVRDAIEADKRLTTEERDEQLDEIEDAMDSEVDFFNLLYNQAEGTVQSEK